MLNILIGNYYSPSVVKPMHSMNTVYLVLIVVAVVSTECICSLWSVNNNSFMDREYY